MRILILTQNDNLYLPKAIARVCMGLSEEVVCIVSAPAMSTHGGAVRGFLRHLKLFGLKGTGIFAWRLLAASARDRFSHPGPDGPFYSVKSMAAAFGVPFHQISKVNRPEFHQLIDRYSPQLLISMSCPQIIGKKLRDRFPKGCINVHGALLPRYRGLMPAFWVLRNSETVTGTTVHDLDAKLDNGDILVQREVLITPQDTWDSLVCKTKATGAEALLEAISHISNGTLKRRDNPEDRATYFSFPTGKDREAFLATGRRFF